MIQWEHIQQVKLYEWAEMRTDVPELELLHAIPNGGKRTKKVAAEMKAEGVKKGMLDNFLPVPRGEYHGFYIELKAKYPNGRTGTTSKEQREWIERLRAQGYKAEVYVGWVGAALAILDYLEVPFPEVGE